MRRLMGDSACEIDCTFRHAEGESALRDAIYRIQAQAADAVRGGCTHVVLTDQAVHAEHAGIPMILAAAAVHTHLVRSQLRTFHSSTVCAPAPLAIHYFPL